MGLKYRIVWPLPGGEPEICGWFRAGQMLGKCVGNYIIEELLGRGGMGEVFLARHPHLDRFAAIKVLDAALNRPDLVGRFFDEAKITASLKHPNVVDIFDFGEVDGRLYYLMELLRGRDLAEEIERRGPLPLPLGIEFLRQICLGLGEVHKAGIVHRDLKPANIFVLEAEPYQLKLMDFGIAKNTALSSRGTSHGQVLGTPVYMSPEQALGQIDQVSPQSDLYSLGIIAHELLTGSPPFEADSPVAVLIRHVHEIPPSLRARLPRVPEELVELVDACLEKDPSRRPKSAAALAAQLKQLLQRLENDAALHAPPSGWRFELPLSAPPKVRHELAYNNTVPDLPDRPTADVPLAAGAVAALKNVAIRDAQGTFVSSPAGSPPANPLPAAETLGHTPGLAAPASGPPSSEPESAPTSTEPTVPAESVSSPPTLTVSLPPRVDDTGAPLSGRPSSIAPLSVDKSHAENEQPISLTKSDRDIFTRLLSKMQRRGDLPAFVANVGEVSTKADFEGKYSANQLSEAILKDYALTAKLLRTVNMLYAARFGVRIHTVQHAIVILGFERVRSIALSISVFNKAATKEQEARATDSAIHALVSGELARELAEMSGLADPEQAMICSMFRNLGRHLLIVYLPEAYEDILRHAQKRDTTEDAASTSLLGISLRKIGLGVAEQWKLPDRIGRSMTYDAAPGADPPAGIEQRLAAFSQLSNELSDLVALGIDSAQNSRVNALLDRHRRLLRLSSDEVQALLARVEDSFRVHYGSLLGKKVTQSQFLANLRALGPSGARPGASRTAEGSAPVASLAPGQPGAASDTRQAELVDPVPHAATPARRDVAVNGGPKIERLALGKAAPGRTEADDPLIVAARELGRLLEQGGPARARALDKALKLAGEVLGAERLLLLGPSDSKAGTLRVQAGVGAHAAEIAAHFELEVQKGSQDIFSKAYFFKKDYLVKDSFTKQKSQPIPPVYFEMIGSPAFALLACERGAADAALLLVDVDDPEHLPNASRVTRLLPLRRALAKAV